MTVAFTYAMSDIHGCLDALEARIGQLDERGFFDEGCEDKLFLLGDYIDRGPDSLGVVRAVMKLEQRCPDRVIALMGNHEDEFLNWLGDGAVDWNDDVLLDDDLDELFAELEPDFGSASSHAVIDRLKMWQLSDPGGNTMRSLLGNDAFCSVESAIALNDADAFERACDRIRATQPDAIRWIRNLRTYYETDSQIFVHAGIDESQGESWFAATPRDMLLNSRRTPRGRFYKDVIAGHTPTSSIVNDPAFHDIFWDGESHYYIDGSTPRTGSLPLLAYDIDKRSYFRVPMGEISDTDNKAIFESLSAYAPR